MSDSRLPQFARVSGLLVCGAAIGVLWMRHTEEPVSPGVTRSYADTATVVLAVRQLARLESVSFHMEKLIDLKERQEHFFGLLETEDAILLAAAGDVVAGVDLAKLRDGDIEIQPDVGKATLRLPEPEILSVRLDNQRTYVHSRRTDLFAKRAVELETVARQHAEEEIRAAAIDAGILAKARESAGHTLTALVRSLGYDHVEIVWQGGGAERKIKTGRREGVFPCRRLADRLIRAPAP
ncbi:MAG TPA: DUF4230 domain-containing protein [Polyangiales bacterium]|nr:DUF4230 domain-containing protein [Polyangiales bacterium]